jgi:uncharacterized UPF0146 family protein
MFGVVIGLEVTEVDVTELGVGRATTVLESLPEVGFDLLPLATRLATLAAALC